MKFQIKKYEKSHVPLVKDFNKRIKSKYNNLKFPESNIPSWLPKEKSSRIFQEYYLLFDNNIVRGGYILKHQDFLINKKIISIADLQFPLSEGIINSNYSIVGVQLTIDALKRSPKLFAMGMGGFSEKLPKLLSNLNWEICEIPFHFMILNPYNFLLNISFLRKTKSRRVFFNILAHTLISPLLIKLLFNLKTKKNKKNSKGFKVVFFERFDDKFNHLWNEFKDSYKLIGVRDTNTLNKLYASSRFKKLAVYENNCLIGWAVVLNTKMNNHKQFGNMRVGSIVDCFASTKKCSKVISSATLFLRECKVDIIVSNHSHKSWNRAFNNIGYLQGPSNYLFAASKDLAREIKPFQNNKNEVFFMRGDGDGPINL